MMLCRQTWSIALLALVFISPVSFAIRDDPSGKASLQMVDDHFASASKIDTANAPASLLSPPEAASADERAVKARDIEDQHSLAEIQDEVQVGKTKITVMSFNLEGRGGNQIDKAGQDRRAALATYLESLCGHPQAPDVLLTQEDYDGEINSCYTAVSSCASEEYWWNDEYKFGDGKHMLNRVYIKSDLQATGVSGSSLTLTTQAMVTGGLNPRCAALATATIKGVAVTLGSFHLSGGYVDDEVASLQVALDDVKPWILNLRALELTTLVHGMGGRVIIGGDTNGFPTGQVAACQGYRLGNILEPAWIKKTPSMNNAAGKLKMKNNFVQYITSPDSIAGGYSRMHAAVPSGGAYIAEPAGADICSDATKSTTLWGGQPDQFYTNIARSGSMVLGTVGLSGAERAPFPRKLSDHNPIVFVTEI